MLKVRKKPGLVMAFRLGCENPLEDYFIKLGKLRKNKDFYEVLTKETRENKGQIADIDSFIKIDRDGDIYPVKACDFEKNHKVISPNIYLETSKARKAFRYDDLDDKIISYLKDKGFLEITDDPDKYFKARIDSFTVYGRKEDYLLIYSEDKKGPCKYDFNFVDKEIFQKTYEIIEQGGSNE